MTSLALPRRGRGIVSYDLSGNVAVQPDGGRLETRRAFAAAHVVAQPLADLEQGEGPVDWDATLAYRRYLWSLGLAVADAMDTAQRGMGMGWPLSRELIERSAREAAAVGGQIACGASTDQLADGGAVDLNEVLGAYQQQIDVIDSAGAQAVVMASRNLVGAASGPDDYLWVYDRLLSQVSSPVIIHWLGEAFDPALRGYWGSVDRQHQVDTMLTVLHEHTARVDGVKVSLLDYELEVSLRPRLPQGVALFTGDDFNFVDLIAGDGTHHSDALLGIFDAIAPVAKAALSALDAGDEARYRQLLEPTVQLSRHLFEVPTRYYKVGVTFLAYLNGHQGHFRLVDGLESKRSLVHLGEAFALADEAGVLQDPELAAHRAATVFAAAGIT